MITLLDFGADDPELVWKLPSSKALLRNIQEPTVMQMTPSATFVESGDVQDDEDDGGRPEASSQNMPYSTLSAAKPRAPLTESTARAEDESTRRTR